MLGDFLQRLNLTLRVLGTSHPLLPESAFPESGLELASPNQTDLLAGKAGVSLRLEEMQVISIPGIAGGRRLGELTYKQERSPRLGLWPCKLAGTAGGSWSTRDHSEGLTGLGPLACCSLTEVLSILE